MITSPLCDIASEKSVYAFPSSFNQEGLCFPDQMEYDGVAYHVPCAMRLRQLLDIEALQRSLHMIVQRHEALRTTFMMSAGQRMQVVAPSLVIALSMVDLQGLAEAEREAEAQRLSDTLLHVLRR